MTFLVFIGIHGFSQDDLDALLDEIEEEEIEYVTGAFKSTRVINLHSIEKIGAKTLDFRISHRFGALNGGAYEFFGLDQASMRLAFEYGINDWLMIGAGRSLYEKSYDGFIKAILVRQSKGKRVMPVTIAYLATTTANTLKWQNPDRKNYFTSRLAYVNQIIIGRKFNSNLSLQLSPTMIHKNLVPTAADQNTSFAIGTSGRYKISNRTTINAEYIYRIPPNTASPEYDKYYNSLSIGVDIETGGHVFALQISNSLAMIEKAFITETSGNWLNGGVHLGFNISREFAFKQKHKVK